jgi:hypothetical protein
VAHGITQVGDPKLDGGGFAVAFQLTPATASTTVNVDILRDDVAIRRVWSGSIQGTDPGEGIPTEVHWDGRNEQGDWVDVGTYTVRVAPASGAASARTMRDDIHVVRLGLRSIEALDSEGNNEHQMVYFKRAAVREFTATPVFHEYLNSAATGETSDLDLDSGEPRPSVAIHEATDEPVMQGDLIRDDRYNYPLAYVRGTVPRLRATLGSNGTAADGSVQGAGYPVAGIDLRLSAASGAPLGSSGPMVPGESVAFDLNRARGTVSRSDVPVTWTWQYAAAGSDQWHEVLGSTITNHRIYTLFGEPRFKANANGTQYKGPWVEVAEYWYQWSLTTGADMNTASGVITNHVKGFFGQNSGIPTAIEDVLYDSPGQGGTSGFTHYFNFSPRHMRLSSLLNGAERGIYVNCSDNMGATATMLSMMGIPNVRPVRLGDMSLNAIWGIGASGYTTNLWGPGQNAFSYHHIVTRDNLVTVIDTCMQLDEDGQPQSEPGTPGWNVDRRWAGVGGYNQLSSTNDTSTELELLPGIR